MDFIAWIITGLIVGTVAKMIMKGSGGWLSSILLGLAGGVVGGFLGNLIGMHGLVMSWILAIIGACLVLFVYNRVTRQRSSR